MRWYEASACGMQLLLLKHSEACLIIQKPQHLCGDLGPSETGRFPWRISHTVHFVLLLCDFIILLTRDPPAQQAASIPKHSQIVAIIRGDHNISKDVSSVDVGKTAVSVRASARYGWLMMVEYFDRSETDLKVSVTLDMRSECLKNVAFRYP